MLCTCMSVLWLLLLSLLSVGDIRSGAGGRRVGRGR